MSIFEYNEEDVRRALREAAHDEGYEEGKNAGRIEDILYFLREKGTTKDIEEFQMSQ